MTDVKLDGVAVYISKIEDNTVMEKLFSEERNREIEEIRNERARLEKYSVFKLLEKAVSEELGISPNEAKIYKNENRRWTSPYFDFSLSHSKGAVAVAISGMRVGVDIEALTGNERTGVAKKYLSESEYAEYEALRGEEKEIYFLSKWTAKEALFKSKNEAQFLPSEVIAANEEVVTQTVDIDGEKYVLSVASENENIQIKTV